MRWTDLLVFLLFLGPSAWLLVSYLKGKEKPKAAAVAGILLSMAVLAAYTFWLMWQFEFY